MECKKKIGNFMCMDVIERATRMEQEGKKIIHFEKGELDFPTPEIISSSAIDAIKGGKTRYTVSTGLMELKEAVCNYYLRKYSVTIKPAQVIINAGSSPALLTLFLGVFSEGDEIILTNPCYSGYPKFVEIAKAKPVYVSTEKNNFQLNIADVRQKITSKTKAIIINSPSNPIGSILTSKDLAELSQLGVFIISDEVYHGLSYIDEPDHSILEFTQNVAVVNSFSKLFAMTGWRLGYIILPEDLIDNVKSLQQNFFVSPNSFVQWAGVTALTADIPELEERRQILKKRKEFLYKGLLDLGFKIPYNPQGAYYIFAKNEKLCSNSVGVTNDLLMEANVAVTPGVDFGSEGEGYLRFSYALSLEDIQEGLERIKQFIAKNN